MPTYRIQNPNQQNLADVLAGAVSQLGPTLVPDPAAKARAGLLQQQGQAAQASTYKDTLEAAKILLETGAIKDLRGAFPTVTNPDGTIGFDPSKVGNAAGIALQAGVAPSVLSELMTGANASAVAARDNQWRVEAAKAEAEARAHQNATDPVVVSPGATALFAPGDPRIPGSSGLSDTMTGGVAVPSPTAVPSTEDAWPARDMGMPLDDSQLPANPSPAEPGLLPGDQPATPLAAMMAPGAPVVKGNAVSVPPKMTGNSNIGTKPIPVQTAAGVVTDLKLLQQISSLKNRLTPDDPNFEQNRSAFHPVLGKVLPTQAVDAIDKGGNPFRAALALMANSQLHDLSGAAVTDPEWQRLMQSIANPVDLDWETAFNKLSEAEDHLKKNLGVTASYFSPENGYVTNTELGPFYKTKPAAGPTPPPAGFQEGGYEFTGGNPADPANWRKLP